MKSIIIICLFLLLLVASFLFGRLTYPKPEITEKRDTITIVKTDTLTILKPHYITEIKIDSIPYKVIDTIMVGDTIYLPKTQKEYKDSSFSAWVSGYHPNLDSIKVYPKTLIQTITKTQQIKSPRLGIGISAGVGYFGGQIKPYIGLGLNYNLWTK